MEADHGATVKYPGPGDSAEYVLKPFVDAILAKYGLKREEEPAGSQA